MHKLQTAQKNQRQNIQAFIPFIGRNLLCVFGIATRVDICLIYELY